ncbi:MAG: OmpA family protein [Planctomycetaceae bacterium]|nr:OmpA family protein [Planctomycetaceae bacterium]
MGRRQPTIAVALLLTAVLTVFSAGCANSSSVLKGNVDQLQQQQVAMQRQNQELHAHAASLDRQHQELTALVAQLRQQIKVEQDRSQLLQTQLASTTSQLSKIQSEKDSYAKQAETLTASLQRQRGVVIKPNNSLLTTLPKINLQGVETRHDGDVIRIELPADQLFQYGTNQFQANAGRIITTVAAEILRTYPNQKIAVEGHTDSDPVRTYQYSSNIQLSTAQAMAVYEVLVSQTRMQPNQMFVVGHGGNHPVFTNATAAGKQRNRRVELVIYPDRAS